MRTSASFALAIVATAFVATLVPSPASAQQNKPEPLNLSYIPSNSIYWDLDAAIEKGFFRDEGFAPEIITGQSSPQMIQMLISGSVEMAIGQPESIIAAIGHGAKELGVIAAPADRPDWFFMTRPDIKGWKDLKGETIGFSSLRVGEYWLAREMLAQHGLGPDDYRAIVVGVTPAKMAAFQKGSIAAAIMFQPTGEFAARKGYKVLVRLSTLKSYPGIVYAVNRNWAGTKDHGKRLARALNKAHAWLYDPKNHDEAISILAKYTKQDRAILEDIYKLYFVTDKLYSKDASVHKEGLARLVSLMVKNGEVGVKETPPPKSYLLPASLGGMTH